MKISIYNFGPIGSFEYDLSKDFIATYGNNNIGKSYSMQIVYLLLKNLINNSQSNFYFHSMFHIEKNPSNNYINNIKNVVEKFVESEHSEIEITDIINKNTLLMIKNIFLPSFINSCNNTFGNFDSIVKNNPEIKIENNGYVVIIKLLNSEVSGSISTKKVFIKKSRTNTYKYRKYNERLSIYYYEDIQSTLNIINQTIEEEFFEFSNSIIELVSDVYFLPASRSGIYSGMSAFSSIIAELSRSKAMLTKKIELPGLSEPISDYFLMLSNIRTRKNTGLQNIYSKIEDDILHGNVNFNNNNNMLVYKPNNLLYEFEMTQVSSMVSEISPIVAFFKYIILNNRQRENYTRSRFSPNSKSIIFIEEPEAHLHPINQLKLIEIFADLNKYGIKLVISSHSNYIFNKLNNLMLSKKLTTDIYSAIILEAIEGKSNSKFLEIDELGVLDENFIDATQQLYEEREEIIKNLDFEEH